MKILRSLVILIAVVACSESFASAAATYYVDSSIPGYKGSAPPSGLCAAADAGSGTSSKSPWCTIAKVVSSQESMTRGDDQILLKRGDTWSEMLSIMTMHGIAGHPLIIGNYGAGALPIISGGGTRIACIDAQNYGFDQSHITVDGIECTQTTQYGIDWQVNQALGAGVVVQNSYIHDTGPGAFAGATVGPDARGVCAAVGGRIVAGSCDDNNYRNQLDFEANSCSGSIASCANGVRFLNNVVKNCGGHNCLQVHHDTGGPQVIGNVVGPGCAHNCIDLKAVVGAVVDSNIATTGPPTFPTGAPAAFYTEDTFQDGETIIFSRNVAYNSIVDFQAEAGGTCTAPGTTCRKDIKWYNNTAISGSVPTALGFPGNKSYVLLDSSCDRDTLDAENNIFDGGNIGWHRSGGGPGCAGKTYDYNDTGGKQRNNSIDITTGAHDLMNVDPLYNNFGGNDFHIRAKSPVGSAGRSDLLKPSNSIGAYTPAPLSR